MKNKYFQLTLFIISISMIFIACDDRPLNLRNNEIAFTITSVNFRKTDWSFLKKNNVNELDITLSVVESPILPPLPGQTPDPNYDSSDNRYLTNIYSISYDSSNQASASGDFNQMTVLESNSDDSTNIYMLSEWKETPATASTYYFGDSITDLGSYDTEWRYTVAPTYDMSTTPMLKEIKITKDNYNIVSGAYDFECNSEIVHQATHAAGDPDENLNIVVLAEGYTVGTQIQSFREYVADAFANTASFHYEDGPGNTHIDNDFFNRYWDERINVFRIDSISPESGIDSDKIVNDRHSILKLNKENENISHARIQRVIRQSDIPLDLKLYQVDAIIIFVNDPGIWAFAYGNIIEKRRGQKVRPIIIQAPAGYDTTASNFHDFVITDAIAHELGHALGQLIDEYEDTAICSQNRDYDQDFRNIDIDTPLKWQWFLDNGYDGSGTIMRNPMPNPSLQGGFYCTNYFRPQDDCTMRRAGHTDLQFCPVCCYHLTATLRIRTGQASYNENNPNPVYNDDKNLEWKTYSLSDFFNTWPPNNF